MSLLLKKVYKSVFKQMSATAYFDLFSQLTFYRGGRGFARKMSPAGETTEGERQPHTPFHPFQGSADIEDPLA